MKKIFSIWSLLVFLSGCATALTQQGAQVRLIDRQSDYKCEFIGTVTGSNTMGATTAHDADGAMNELRNKAAAIGANSVRVLNIDSSTLVTTAVGEALNCKF